MTTKYQLGIGRAEYTARSEYDAKLIREFLVSMRNQGECGFWQKTITGSDPIELEQPKRTVEIRAQDLADAIDAIRQLCDELDQAKHYCNDEDHASIENRIAKLGELWDKLSDAIE